MSTVADRYRRLAAEVTRRVAAVPADRWDDPSPCEGWSARAVLQHLLDSHRDMPAHVGLTVPTDVPVADDPVGAWAQARDGLQALLDDPATATLEYDGYFGRTSLEKTVDGFLCLDLLVHGWDIAKATGGDVTLPADEVERVSQTAHSLGDSIRMEGVCGPPVTVADDATAQDRLLAHLGRTP